VSIRVQEVQPIVHDTLATIALSVLSEPFAECEISAASYGQQRENVNALPGEKKVKKG
jgi:hypothetical protein